MKNKNRFNIKSLSTLMKVHLELGCFANYLNFVLSVPIVIFVTNVFIWIVSNYFNTIKQISDAKEFLVHMYAVSLLGWGLVHFIIMYFMCKCWVSLSDEVSFILFNLIF